MTPTERFLSKFTQAEGDECWIWLGAPSNRGYGQLTVGRTTVTAHRFSYEHYVGPIPAGHDVDHLCGTRLCVNPCHLEPVTHRENLLRSDGFAGVNARKTHCPHGHEYTAENTYVNPNPNGGRICRTCKRARDTAIRERKRTDVIDTRSVSVGSPDVVDVIPSGGEV